MFIKELNEEVYEILSNVTGLKFKPQIKNSGIDLKKIHEMKDLVKESIKYVLLLDDTVIPFKDTKEFILKFHKHLSKNLDELQKEFDELQHHEQNDLFLDENFMYNQHERIGNNSHKQRKLLKKMEDFFTKLE